MYNIYTLNNNNSIFLVFFFLHKLYRANKARMICNCFNRHG